MVELEEGLHMLLQDNTRKLFNIEAHLVRVCGGGRSAYVKGKNKDGRVQTFLRNRRFKNHDPRFRSDGEVTMATGEGEVGSDGCLSLRQLCGKDGSVVRRAKGLVSSILKGTLAMLTTVLGSAAGSPRRKAVRWAQSISQ